MESDSDGDRKRVSIGWLLNSEPKEVRVVSRDELSGQWEQPVQRSWGRNVSGIFKISKEGSAAEVE